MLDQGQIRLKRSRMRFPIVTSVLIARHLVRVIPRLRLADELIAKVQPLGRLCLGLPFQPGVRKKREGERQLSETAFRKTARESKLRSTSERRR